MPHRARDRAGRAVERELEPTAEAGPVDRGDGGKRQPGNPRKEHVAGPAALGCDLRRDRGELVDVGAGAEPERLASEDRGDPVAALELGEQSLGRRERGPAERGRLRPVLAVVDRDERERPCRGVHRAQVEDGVSHRRAPRRSRRPCRARCRGRSARSAPPAARGTRTRAAPRGGRRWPRADGRRRSRRRRG